MASTNALSVIVRCSGAILVLTLWAGGALAQVDGAQQCMFQCAPVIGTSKYDACLDACFSESEETGANDAGVDFSPLHGYWIDAKLACGTPSMDAWDIGPTGASQFDFTCSVNNARRDGKTFVLEQSCEELDGETGAQRTDRFRLTGKNRMEAGGKLYRRCERP